jgi:putative ABC transport system permease protein
MNRWLQNFAYKTRIGIETFMLSGIIAFFVALLTVSYQSIKAAQANPAESLKYE